jgi:hypothetical protein
MIQTINNILDGTVSREERAQEIQTSQAGEYFQSEPDNPLIADA